MKAITKILSVAFLAGSLLTSCLKDEAVTDYTQIKPIVIVPNGNWPRSQSITPLAIENSETPYEARVYARVSFEDPLSKDVVVTFKEDPQAIADYNTKFGTNYVTLNSDAYTIASLTVTIPAGEREAFLPVLISAGKVNLAQKNMLAFTITDASGESVSSNFASYLLPLTIKNNYDANYTVTGYFFHPSAPRAISADKAIKTVDLVRSEAQQLGDLGGWLFRFDTDETTGKLSNWEGLGSTFPAPSSGFYTADNPGNIGYPGPEYPGQGEYKFSQYNNSYDAANKTFWMHYGYGGGSTDQNGWTRNVYEKWVRK